MITAVLPYIKADGSNDFQPIVNSFANNRDQVANVYRE